MRLLVVDDNEDIRYLIRMILQAEGHEVVEARSGLDALQTLEGAQQSFSVVLLDVQMPDMTGWEVLRQIRFHPPLRDLPVVMCTVKDGETDHANAERLDCDGYVTKPFDPTRLIAAITKAVTSRRVTRC